MIVTPFTTIRDALVLCRDIGLTFQVNFYQFPLFHVRSLPLPCRSSNPTTRPQVSIFSLDKVNGFTSWERAEMECVGENHAGEG